MAPTLETPPVRIYCIRVSPAEVIRIRADTMCEGRDRGSETTFKREGEVVGRIRGQLAAWWIEEHPSDS